MARRKKGVLEADRDRRGDRVSADDRRRFRPVVDDGVLGEERGHRLRLVVVEVEAVGVDQVRDRLPVGKLLDEARLHASGVDGPVGGLGGEPVAAQQVCDRVLGKAEAVVDAEPVRAHALRVVEVDLLGDAREQRLQSGRKVVAGLGNACVLACGERVARRLDHARLTL